MFVVNIIAIIFLINCVSAIDDQIPKMPSQYEANSKKLPERSEIVKMNPSFQEYIPVACFCDREECEASVKSIESPIIGLFTRDGRIVQSLDIRVKLGELMFIVLINRSSSLADETYLERTSYWSLLDIQHERLPGAALDFAITQEVSVLLIKSNSMQFSFTKETKRAMITALEKSTGLNILIADESNIKWNYRYEPSQLNQMVGIYQLIHELVVHPGVALTNYIGSQKRIARCASFPLSTVPCGSLQILPSFIQRTTDLRAVIVTVPTTTTTSTATTPNTASNSTVVTTANNGIAKTTIEIDQKDKMSGGSEKAKAILISISVIVVVAALLSASVWYYRKRRNSYSSLLSVQADIIRTY